MSTSETGMEQKQTSVPVGPTEERDLIVTWLRRLSDLASDAAHAYARWEDDDKQEGEYWSKRWAIAGDLADAIERGAHLTGDHTPEFKAELHRVIAEAREHVDCEWELPPESGDLGYEGQRWDTTGYPLATASGIEARRGETEGLDGEAAKARPDAQTPQEEP